MDRELAGYRRLLHAWRAAADSDPKLHACELAALDRELTIASVAADLADCARRGGDLALPATGAAIDRTVAHAAAALAVDDPWLAAALAHELEARGDAHAAPLRTASAQVHEHFTALVLALPRLRERRTAEAAVAALAQLDRIDLDRPRYRWRMPWADPSAFVRWLDPLLARYDGARPTVPAADAIRARIDTAAVTWRADLRAHGDGSHRLPRAPLDRVVARYAAGPIAPALLATMRAAATSFDAEAIAVEQGAAAQLAAAPAAAHAERLLARQAAWPEPLVERHARTLLAALAAAATPTAVHALAARAERCFAIERAWLAALVATVAAPLRAALLAHSQPSDAALASIAAARDTADALVGETDPWRVPWFAALVAHAVAPCSDLEAARGEAGGDLVGPWRAWIGARAARRDDDVLAAARALTAASAPARSPRRRIRLWDVEVALDGLDALRARPARPC